MADTVAGVPSKVARLDQSGIGRAIDVVRRDPAMTRQTAAQLRTDPRAVIGQVFQLNSEQQAGLAALSDNKVQEIGTLVADALARDPGALEYSYMLMPAPSGEPAAAKCSGSVKAFGIEVSFTYEGGPKMMQPKPVRE